MDIAVYHLEMREREAFLPSAVHEDLEVVLVDPPDPELNHHFYEFVGAQWKWTDRFAWSPEEWQSHVDRSTLYTYVGKLNGCDVGYAELEAQSSGNVEIVYFGLLPEHIGKGLGGPLLSAIVECAWNISGAQRVWVHTCTYDHEHALENYRARGFELFKTEQKPPNGK